MYKPGREFWPATGHAGTLIRNFQPPELWENKCLLLKPPLWNFVAAALVDEDGQQQSARAVAGWRQGPRQLNWVWSSVRIARYPLLLFMNECIYESLEVLSSLLFPSPSFGARTLFVGAGLRSRLVRTSLPHASSPGLLAVTRVSLLPSGHLSRCQVERILLSCCTPHFQLKTVFFLSFAHFKRQLDRKGEKQDVIIAFSFSNR